MMNVRFSTVVGVATLLLATTLTDMVLAQRGGRGGGRGGGWSGGSNNSNRSVSSNRSSSNFSRGSSQQHESFYRGSDSDRSARNWDGRDNDDGNRSFSRSQGGDRDRGRSSDRDSDHNRSLFSDRDRGSRDRDFADRTRRDFGGFDRRDLPFRYGWWDTYGLAGYPIYSPWRYSRWRDRPYYWWGWSSPRGLTDWLVYGFDRPAYWNYGPGGNIWYDGDYVYYDGRRRYSADDYYRHLDDLVHDVPDIDQSAAEKMDWKPLGVFAVRRENDSDSTRTMQLAVNRDGVITGTYFIQSKKQARPLEGRVDETSQRATWTFADGEKGKDDVIFETSVYNLTKQSTNIMVHFGPKASDAEIWQLVRLEQPDADATTENTQR
jgi:hypothetical protein